MIQLQIDFVGNGLLFDLERRVCYNSNVPSVVVVLGTGKVPGANGFDSHEEHSSVTKKIKKMDQKTKVGRKANRIGRQSNGGNRTRNAGGLMRPSNSGLKNGGIHPDEVEIERAVLEGTARDISNALLRRRYSHGMVLRGDSQLKDRLMSAAEPMSGRTITLLEGLSGSCPRKTAEEIRCGDYRWELTKPREVVGLARHHVKRALIKCYKGRRVIGTIISGRYIPA